MRMLRRHKRHDAVPDNDSGKPPVRVPVDRHAVSELWRNHLDACHKHEGAHSGSVEGSLDRGKPGGEAVADKEVGKHAHEDADGREGRVGKEDGKGEPCREAGRHDTGAKGKRLDPLVGKEGNQEACQIGGAMLAGHAQALHEGVQAKSGDKDEGAQVALSQLNAIHLTSSARAQINGVCAGHGLGGAVCMRMVMLV